MAYHAFKQGHLGKPGSLITLPFFRILFELFCLQNSLIVSMQPQVSGKVGSLVGWLVGWFLGGPCSAFPTTVEFYRKASCRAGTKMQMRTHGKFCY